MSAGSKKTVLDLSHTEAREFFLKEKSYCNIDLPPYYAFQPLLNALSVRIEIFSLDADYEKAKNADDINYKFFTNKDGKFDWRPLQLINPALYVFLVHEITREENWKSIRKRFAKFQQNLDKIECCSIPVISEEEGKSDKAANITNWWETVEQQSIELALEYDCMLNTDITNCYGSIYTHSIAWALRGKDIAKKQREKNIFANKIDNIIQSMQYGQTNGIPQGSVLMDFIAEMVLGYADRLLLYKIKKYNHTEEKYKIDDYKILRYRDDYRIFTKSQETAVKIAKLLTEVLADLNFKLNAQKTFMSNNIIRDAIKPDKLDWNSSKQRNRKLQNHLLLIHSLAEKHPNSGSLEKAMNAFYNKIKICPLKLFKEDHAKILISILVDIAYNNPRTYPLITAILSKILSLETDKKFIDEILKAIENKFKKIPNIGHMQVWLQRVTLKIERDKDYEELLCKKVLNPNVKIWNIDWLDDKIKDVFNDFPIIDEDKIKEMPLVIDPSEVAVYNNRHYA
jgi:hypothetical protein